jgi:alpha-amylase/alpha-mannosidase (GH57 family)
MALAYCLRLIESQNLAKIINYGEYLEKHPPTHGVEIIDDSSWSCVHGVERWKGDCGCNSGTHPGWNQVWRKPLREAMDWLRDTLTPLFEDHSRELLKDPWKARDEYIDVILDRTEESIEGFLKRNCNKDLSREEKVKVLKLLEMQRNAMLMYTSCGWFFDEISGIETAQVLRYAGRAVQLAEGLFNAALEKEFLQRLEKAPSNIPEFEQGAKIYEMFVKPAMVGLLRVGVHYAISSLFEEYPESTRIYCYQARSEVYDKTEAGRIRLALGQTHIQSQITREEETISFAVLHLGDHNLNGGVRGFMGEEAFSAMRGEIKETFTKGDIPEVIRLMDKHYGMNNYSLWHLFRDEQRKVLSQVLLPVMEGIEIAFRKIYEESYAIMNFLQGLQMPIPKPLTVAAQYVINSDLKKALENGEWNTEKIENLVRETKKWSPEIDKETIGYVATAWINSSMERLSHQPEEMALLGRVEDVLKLLNSLSIEVDLWKAQNICFSIGKALGKEMNERVEKGDDSARTWVETYRQLCAHLHVKVM